jgi:hypothetical protein
MALRLCREPGHNLFSSWQGALRSDFKLGSGKTGAYKMWFRKWGTENLDNMLDGSQTLSNVC